MRWPAARTCSQLRRLLRGGSFVPLKLTTQSAMLARQTTRERLGIAHACGAAFTKNVNGFAAQACVGENKINAVGSIALQSKRGPRGSYRLHHVDMCRAKRVAQSGALYVANAGPRHAHWAQFGGHGLIAPITCAWFVHHSCGNHCISSGGCGARGNRKLFALQTARGVGHGVRGLGGI